MDYYEELGIQRDATPPEIRQAYKLAARLLHPDLQPDLRLKCLAECQMRRLSEVVSTLLKPSERARYDAALRVTPRPKTRPLLAVNSRSQMWHTAANYWFWILLAAITFGMGVWYGLAPSPEMPSRFTTAEDLNIPKLAAPAGPKPPPAKARDGKLPPGAKGPDRAEQRLSPLRDTAPEMAAETASNASPLISVVSPESAIRGRTDESLELEGVAARAQSGTAEGRFGGHWLFAVDETDDIRGGEYPARYVEFVLHEDRGRLFGEYRAVYRQLDKAISPEVVFHVKGEMPPGSAGSLEWESKGGAKGELELTLQAPNRLLVKWWTTKFGRQEALSSGMAGLMRLKAP